MKHLNLGRVPPRIKKQLQVQEYLCPCGRYIHGGNYYTGAHDVLVCGNCALRAMIASNRDSD